MYKGKDYLAEVKEGEDEEAEKKEEEEGDNPLEEARKATAELRAANRERRELLEREERLSVQKMLSGQATAGVQSKRELTQDEKETEGARNLLKGTGFEDQLFPQKND